MEVRTSNETNRIVELANQLVWKTPDLDLLRERPENEYALIPSDSPNSGQEEPC